MAEIAWIYMYLNFHICLGDATFLKNHFFVKKIGNSSIQMHSNFLTFNCSEKYVVQTVILIRYNYANS